MPYAGQDSPDPDTEAATLRELTDAIVAEEAALREGSGEKGRRRQQKHGRLTARERLSLLLDSTNDFFEIGLWAAHGMYEEWGPLPAAGVVAGIGRICGRACMVVANDATVKAGAMFPQSVKKLLRAQRIAYTCRLPTIYLVDSAGVFLPLQDEIFPDEDDFGRIFRNNSVMSAAGIPQFAAVMGNCIAGGAYLPVLCDKMLMTEGSGLYLAGAALVKAAIGQDVDAEELGGAKMHAEISGTADFHEPNDEACLQKLRALVDMLPPDDTPPPSSTETAQPPDALYDLVSGDARGEYDARQLLASIVDKDSMQEYKANYGQTLITAYATIGGHRVGIVATQRLQSQSQKSGVEIGGVIYTESSDKAARFIMDCNQIGVPLVFFQDVMGFMVGREADQAGIIRCGAKLVNVVSNSVVPKITVIVGNSFGAGNYALCGKAYDPTFIVAWPNAKYAVMGAEQAAGTILTIRKSAAERRGTPLSDDELQQQYDDLKARYDKQTDIRYGAARGWVDAIIAPHHTRDTLTTLLTLAKRQHPTTSFHTGVIQV